MPSDDHANNHTTNIVSLTIYDIILSTIIFNSSIRKVQVIRCNCGTGTYNFMKTQYKLH